MAQITYFSPDGGNNYVIGFDRPVLTDGSLAGLSIDTTGPITSLERGGSVTELTLNVTSTGTAGAVLTIDPFAPGMRTAYGGYADPGDYTAA